ncbi:hypothetical protein BgiMline_031517 [Biomphalaria glabrata]|nr:hypothetical protein BgiMline_019744 [Biomphalaria glabrata]
MDFLNIIKLIFLMILTLKGLLPCPPAQEGKHYVMSSTWSIDPGKIITVSWRKEGEPIGSCASFTKCRSYRNDTYVITIYQTSKDTLTSEVFIKNVSRFDEGLWKLIYIDLRSPELDIFNCTLNVYAKPNLSLEHCPNEVEEDVLIRCICISSLRSAHSPLWFHGSNVIHNEFNNVLSFRANIKMNETFTCRQISEKNITLNFIEYNPTVITKKSLPLILNINGIIWKKSSVEVGYKRNVSVECPHFMPKL